MGDGPGAALLVLVAPAGARALWVPPLGRAELADEHEVLLARRTPLVFRTRTRVGGTLVLEGEVIP
jgi:hypothetical protein